VEKEEEEKYCGQGLNPCHHMIEGNTYHYTKMTYCYVSHNIYIILYYILKKWLAVFKNLITTNR
jgi:hypothetical protein